MKNLKKRMAAICMALLVSTSMLPLDAFAAEYTGSTESATEVTTDVPVSGDTEQPATEVPVDTEQPATEVPVDTEQQTEAPADTEQAVESDAAAYEAVEAEAEEDAAMEEQMDAEDEALEEEDDTEEADTLLAGSINYLTVDAAQIQAPGTQNVVVSIGSDDTTVDSATLSYKNVTTGEEKTVAAGTIKPGAVLFSMSYSDTSERSVYQLSGVTYTIGKQTFYADFAANGIDAKYGVNQETETNPDAVMTDDKADEEAQTDLDGAISVVSIDENGNEVQESSIAEAIDAASEGTPESAVSVQSADETLLTAKNVVVVLDPGHGGSDSGTTGGGLKEKNLNLKIAQYCKAELEQYYGVTVYMTRTTDTYVSLDDRTTMAKNWGANVIVSIHINNSSSTSASGVEIYYPNSNYNSQIGSQGSALASRILSQLTALGLTNRGTKIRNANDTTYPDGSKADYYSIIRNAKIKGFPGIIVEHAFLSNSKDVSFLSSDANLKRVGVADATGIAQYFGLSKQASMSIDSITTTESKGALTVNVGYTTNASGIQFRYTYYDVNKGSWGLISEWTTASSVKWKPTPGTYWIQVSAIDSNNIAKVSTVGFQNNTDYSKSYLALNGICYQVKDHSIDAGVAYETDASSVQFRWLAYNLKTQEWSSISDWYAGNWTTWYAKAGDYWLYVEAKTNDGVTKNYTICFHAAEDHTNDYVNLNGICYQIKDHSIDVGVAYDSGDPKVKFRWQAYNLDTGGWETIADWNGGNWATWTPHAGNYWLQAQATTSSGTVAAYTICFAATKDYSADYIKVNGVCVVQSTGKVDLGASYESNDSNVQFMWQIYDLSSSQWTTITTWTGANWTTWKPASGSYWIYVTARTSKGSTATFCQGVTLNMGYAIMGSSGTTLTQMINYYNSKAIYPTFYMYSDAPTIMDFCRIYVEECTAEGVKPEVAFCQTMKETGFLTFGGDVSITQYNFAGLGATGNGATGDSFSSVREGVRAQVQHLKAYASTASLSYPCVDKRFSYVSRGCAPYVEWLGISENPYGKGWATAKKYGYSIVNGYISKLLAAAK